ncbi:MAG: hypothetical protein R3Y26_10165 [Rikenellaceae bacterium]
MVYLVKYRGTFGFIKPWSAVRDSDILSQQFLTPSIVTGIERKLFPELLINDKGEIENIVGHRLNYKAVTTSQEQVQTRGWNKAKVKGTKNIEFYRSNSILKRGVLIEPTLWLAFREQELAQRASVQHICLCRNEDILYPEGDIIAVSSEEFNSNEEFFAGYELVFERNEESFIVGYNRFNKGEPMYGYIRIV